MGAASRSTNRRRQPGRDTSERFSLAERTHDPTTRTHASLALATLAALGLAAALPQAAHAQTTTYTFTTLDPFGSTFTFALGINALGQVVGDYNDPVSGNTYGYLATPVLAPEPSQSAALGVGLLGLGALALKARKRRAA